MYNIKRFIDAQEKNNTYETALKEIRNGHKDGHWIWYIFPQVKGLGRSEYSVYYGINGKAEAKEYIENDILRERLLTICQALYDLDTTDIMSVMWEIDCHKVRSCVTLFREVAPEYPIFSQIIDKYFRGNDCYNTLEILEKTN